MKMKALTVWQPWASLVIGGWKPYEFRPNAPPSWMVGQRFVVHAGKRRIVPREVVELIDDLENGRNCGGLDPACISFLQRCLEEPGCVPYSAGLGSVMLGKPVLSSALWPEEFANDSDRLDKANWALPLLDIQRFEPVVPARGFQGWWPWVGETRP